MIPPAEREQLHGPNITERRRSEAGGEGREAETGGEQRHQREAQRHDTHPNASRHNSEELIEIKLLSLITAFFGRRAERNRQKNG